MTNSNTEAVGETVLTSEDLILIEAVADAAESKDISRLCGSYRSLLTENKRLRELLEHVNRAGQLMQGCSTCAEIRALEADLLNPPEKDLNQ